MTTLTLFLSTGKAREPKIPKREATAVRTPSTVSGTPESYTKAVWGWVGVYVCVRRQVHEWVTSYNWVILYSHACTVCKTVLCIHIWGIFAGIPQRESNTKDEDNDNDDKIYWLIIKPLNQKSPIQRRGTYMHTFTIAITFTRFSCFQTSWRRKNWASLTTCIHLSVILHCIWEVHESNLFMHKYLTKSCKHSELLHQKLCLWKHFFGCIYGCMQHFFTLPHPRAMS